MKDESVIGQKHSCESHHLIERVLQFCLLWVFRAAKENEHTHFCSFIPFSCECSGFRFKKHDRAADLFFSKESQYRASSSGDLLDD